MLYFLARLRNVLLKYIVQLRVFITYAFVNIDRVYTSFATFNER